MAMAMAKANHNPSTDEEQHSGDDMEEENSESEFESASETESEPQPEQPPKKPPVSAPKKTQNSSSSAASGSESESEPEQTPKKSAVSAPKKPQNSPSSSGSGSGSGSDSESGSDPDTHEPDVNPTLKPIALKPMNPMPVAGVKRPVAAAAEDGGAAKKSTSKQKYTSPTKPVTGAKRPGAAAEDGGAVKKTKKVETLVQKATPNEDVKRQLFQRIWSEDDEIAILKGMIDYRVKKRSDPASDLNAFHEFIKKSLHVDVSKAQLQDKIRRLKRKYENNAGKEKKGKKERTFSKPHEEKSYDLSKKIWGNDNVVESNGIARKEERKSGVNDNGVKEEGEKIVEVVMKNENDVVEGFKSLSFGRNVDAMENWLEDNLELLSVEKRDEMKEKLTSLRFAEMELWVKRAHLMLEQMNLVMQAMKASRRV